MSRSAQTTTNHKMHNEYSLEVRYYPFFPHSRLGRIATGAKRVSQVISISKKHTSHMWLALANLLSGELAVKFDEVCGGILRGFV